MCVGAGHHHPAALRGPRPLRRGIRPRNQHASGLPGIYQAALHPAASDLFGQLKANMACVGEAMAAARGLLAAG
jgi:tetrahydromethanopterin S-methyltransferase subunit C